MTLRLCTLHTLLLDEQEAQYAPTDEITWVSRREGGAESQHAVPPLLAS